jgi:hypothetical protein
MNADGQIYFAPENEIPLADLKRMQDAELTDAQQLELSRRAAAQLNEELLRAFGSAE